MLWFDVYIIMCQYMSVESQFFFFFTTVPLCTSQFSIHSSSSFEKPSQNTQQHVQLSCYLCYNVSDVQWIYLHTLKWILGWISEKISASVEFYNSHRIPSRSICLQILASCSRTFMVFGRFYHKILNSVWRHTYLWLGCPNITKILETLFFFLFGNSTYCHSLCPSYAIYSSKC